ncbi:hypothetical protein LEMLEM_LOCUS4389 [Lemmus lemmus]
MLLRIERLQKQSRNSCGGRSPEPAPPSSSPHSCGCGSCSRSPDFHGLHGIRNSSSIHSSQDDVSICNRQWRRSCSRKPGGHTSVSGGPWTFYINERDPG